MKRQHSTGCRLARLSADSRTYSTPSELTHLYWGGWKTQGPMALDRLWSSWLLRVPLQLNHLNFYDLSTEKLIQQEPVQEADSTTDGKFLTPAFTASPHSSSLNIMASLQPELPARLWLLPRFQLCGADPPIYVCSLHPYANIRLLWWNLAMVNSIQIIPFWGLKQKPRAPGLRSYLLPSWSNTKARKTLPPLVKLWSWLAQIRNTSLNLPSFFLTEGPHDSGR